MRENKSNLPATTSKLLALLKPQLQHRLSTRSSQFQQLTLPLNLISLFLSSPDCYSHLIPNLSSHLTTLPSLLLHSTTNPQPNSYEQALLLSRLRVVFEAIPYSTQIYKTLGSITKYDIGRWLVVEGTIVRMMQRRTLEKSKMYQCVQCGKRTRLLASYHNSYVFQTPPECTNLVEKDKQDNMFTKLFARMDHRRSKSKDSAGDSKKSYRARCGCRKFKACDTDIVYLDYQQFKLQEPFRHLVSGRMPQTITVLVEGSSLVDRCRAGDDIYISGVLHHRFQKLLKDRVSQAQLIILANNITSKKLRSKRDNIDDSQSLSQISLALSEHNLYSEDLRLEKELALREDILNMFCPELYGRSVEKLGVLLCVLGGVPAMNQSTKIRGQSHLLLVGEPGTGKSVLLQAASELSERAFFINAICCSSAGLTVTHLKEKGSWVLEPGALVLADQGVCCIDELNMMDKKDLSSLLQAMEQQTVSSAKAGVIGKLNCRTTVLAACNPILPGQKFDRDLDMVANTGLSPPLISRFDLVLVLVDESDVETNFRRANHILEKYMNAQDIGHQSNCRKKNLGRLRAMFKKAKTLEPSLKHSQILQNYFVAVRQQQLKTVRAFESLCRLTQAHAKLMLRDQTTLFDCISIITMMKGQHANTLFHYQSHLAKYSKLK